MSESYVLASNVVAVMKTMHEEGYCIGNNEAMLRIFEELANLKMVEAEPVVHAHWDGDWCSLCGELSEQCYPRCPYCGAHMDEEVADD